MVLSFSRFWSTSSFPLSMRTQEFPHRCSGLCPRRLIKVQLQPVSSTDLLTKEKNSVVVSQETNSIHWPGQSTARNLPPLSSRDVIHLSRGKRLPARVLAASHQKNLQSSICNVCYKIRLQHYSLFIIGQKAGTTMSPSSSF